MSEITREQVERAIAALTEATQASAILAAGGRTP